MTNRVLLGYYNGVFSAKISKPGKNVLTAPYKDLLFDGEKRLMSVRQTGVAAFPSGSNTLGVAYPNYGDIPLVLWFFSTDAGLTYVYPLGNGPTPPHGELTGVGQSSFSIERWTTYPTHVVYAIINSGI